MEEPPAKTMRATVTHKFEEKVKAAKKARNPDQEEIQFITEELVCKVKCPTGRNLIHW